MIHGVAPRVKIPEWVGILQASKEWGTPPWAIYSGYASKRWWLMKWNQYMSIREQAQKIKIENDKRKAESLKGRR